MYKGFLGYYLGEYGTQTGIAFFLLTTLGFAVIIFSSYLLGSCNFAIIISKKFYHEDIRTYGSGNAGMTNMLRTYGNSAAAATLFADALKAVLSIVIGRLIWGIVGAYMAGLLCMLGHVFPVFYKFIAQILSEPWVEVVEILAVAVYPVDSGIVAGIG